MSDAGTGAKPDPDSLRALLRGLKELPPRVRTNTRRELRGIGDDVIEEQKGILSGSLPTGTQKAGWRNRLVLTSGRGRGKNRVKTYRMIKVNIYEDVDVKNAGRSTGMREAIKRGLKTRVVTGAKRQGIDIVTTGPKTGDPKFNQAKFWTKKKFRHPLFGDRSRYLDQKGQPYFHAPIYRGRDAMVRRAAEILTDAVRDV